MAIEIFGGIGWDVTVADISRQIRESPAGPLSVRINSPGGSVFDGLAIASMLRRHGDVTAYVDGIAASAASIIAISAARRVMAPGTFLMIHNPSSIAQGEATDFRQEADVLDSIAGEMAKLYADASGGKMDPKTCLAMMDAETWLTADQAIECGLVHAVEGVAPKLASIDKTRHNYHNIPKEIAMPEPNETPAPRAGLIDTILAKIGGGADALAAKDLEISGIRSELSEAQAALVDAVSKVAEAQASVIAKDAEIETMKTEHIAAIEAAKIEASQSAVANVLLGSAPAPLSHLEPDPSAASPMERYNRLHEEGKAAEAFAFYEAHEKEIDSERRKADKERA